TGASAVPSEASFRRDSERRERSSEAGSALNFWLLFFQEKSNRKIIEILLCKEQNQQLRR
ncbi:hypothetical protein, partial [uncultured Parabacteroides sp.]|uniref:hypothetical protein n=1 Tax=uncultured Parabacteroides sp. TaxID=512312 RepID=UPI00266BB423